MDPTDLARIEECPRLTEIVAIEAVLRDQNCPVGVLCLQRDEPTRLLLVNARRLLTDHVLARREAIAGDSVAQRDRQRDEHRLNVVAPQQVVVVRVVVAHRAPCIVSEMCSLVADRIGKCRGAESPRHLTQGGPMQVLYCQPCADDSEPHGPPIVILLSNVN